MRKYKGMPKSKERQYERTSSSFIKCKECGNVISSVIDENYLPKWLTCTFCNKIVKIK